MTTGVWLVVQSREPSALFLVRDPFSAPRVVSLGGASMFDTAHELFHRDAGAGIACASCHAEGEEDGRVWQFNPTGPRRTQAVNVGLTGTEPFHWDGDMKDFGTLVDEVMVRRMGGAPRVPGPKDRDAETGCSLCIRARPWSGRAIPPRCGGKRFLDVGRRSDACLSRGSEAH